MAMQTPDDPTPIEDMIKKMTVAELTQFVKRLEQTFGRRPDQPLPPPEED